MFFLSIWRDSIALLLGLQSQNCPIIEIYHRFMLIFYDNNFINIIQNCGYKSKRLTEISKLFG